MWGQPPNPFGGDLVQPMRVDVPQLPPMAAAVRQKPKFFAKDGAWRDIAGIIADAIAAGAGGQGMYAPMKMKLLEQARQDEREAAKYDRQRTDERSDFVWKSEYEQAHPKPEAPTSFQRDYEYLKTVDPATADKFLRNRGLKTVTVFNPQSGAYELQEIGGDAPGFTPGMVRNGYRFRGGDATDKANWEPVGGPTPGASGGFR